jgi:23S rRNA pseudouridine1911/1915/1917 synthase
MAHLGHPVLGDLLYGGRKKGVESIGVDRQLLHAWRLELRHPINGECFCFEAPLPSDMVRAVEKLREIA